MTITNITVTAGRTFNHPHEEFSNLRPEVTLHATLDEGDDRPSCIERLQNMAEGLVEDHKQKLLKSLEELHQLTERQAEMRGLQREMERAQTLLNELRQKHPELALTNGGAS